jgi:hypothetical protein
VRFRLLCQVLATVATLGWVPGNPAKLMTMVVIWLLGFGRIRAAELVAMAAVNLLFVLMNQAALRQGTFVFDHPDFLGMPAYEFLTWGFYTLHTMRFLNGPSPQGRWIIVAGATGTFAVPFGTIADPDLLFLASAALLVLLFAMYHEPMDFVYAGYMAVVGELVEHVGEATGQWILGSLGTASRCGYCPCGPASDCLRAAWSCLYCGNLTAANRHDDYKALTPRRYGRRRRAPSGPPLTGSIEIQQLR